jgi:hypothetical protein
MKPKKTSSLILALIFLLLFAAFLIPRMFSIMQFVMIDEVNWLHRSANFYAAVKNKDWEDTFVNPSPGVITTWVGSLAFKVEAPYYRIARDSMISSYTSFETVLKMKGGNPLLILRTARVIMVSLLIFILLVSYFYSGSLFGVFPSLVGFLLIALDPYFIALTRMNHLDAPVAVFMFLSLLTFLNFLVLGKGSQFLILSGIAGGLCFSNKLTGLFIIPIIGGISVLGIFWGNFNHKGSQRKQLVGKFWQLCRSLLIWLIAFFLAFLAVWPVMWVQPGRTLSRMFSVSTSFSATISDPISSEVEPDQAELDEIESDQPEGFSHYPKYYLRYPGSFLWRTTPAVLGGLLLGLIGIFARFDYFKEVKIRRGIVGIFLFVLIFTVLLSLPTKSGEKYYAPAYLAVDLFAGLGWYAAFSSLTQKSKLRLKKITCAALLVIVAASQSVYVFQHYPYYYTYYNPLLGGLEKRAATRFVGVGEGLDEMGRYLGARENSSKYKVLSWYGVGSFSYYFDGQVVPIYMGNSDWSPEFVEQLREMDYLITYINQKHRNQPPELFEILGGVEPVYTVELKGVEYAWLYEVDSIPLAK